jgi:hypothetical protein
MDEMNYKGQSTSWWITSLAISVVCCAVLFVVFAGYVFDMKETMAALRMRIEMTDQRFADVNAELETLRHRMTVQQIQVVPSPTGAAVQLPVSTMPVAPAAGISLGTAAPAITPPAIMPPAAAPTAVPEVPALPAAKP